MIFKGGCKEVSTENATVELLNGDHLSVAWLAKDGTYHVASVQARHGELVVTSELNRTPVTIK